MSGAGWNLKIGEMNIYVDYQEALIHFFSKGNIMKNLYKLLLLKSILEIEETKDNVLYNVAINFAELYFLYKTKYPVNITIYNGVSEKSTLDVKVEEIYAEKIYDYEKISVKDKELYINEAREVLKKNVIGAFYTSLKKVPYSFDIKYENLKLNRDFKRFLDRNRENLEEIIELRIIEFLKISEKNKEVLENILGSKGFSKETDYYVEINKRIHELVY